MSSVSLSPLTITVVFLLVGARRSIYRDGIVYRILHSVIPMHSRDIATWCHRVGSINCTRVFPRSSDRPVAYPSTYRCARHVAPRCDTPKVYVRLAREGGCRTARRVSLALSHVSLPHHSDIPINTINRLLSSSTSISISLWFSPRDRRKRR